MKIPAAPVSAVKILPNSADESTRGVAPNSANRALRLSLARPALISRLSRLIISAAVLRAQASDLRAAASRRVMEAAARSQVLMLVPVVFLVLPVCVVFAFFPAIRSLQQLAP